MKHPDESVVCNVYFVYIVTLRRYSVTDCVQSLIVFCLTKNIQHLSLIKNHLNARNVVSWRR